MNTENNNNRPTFHFGCFSGCLMVILIPVVTVVLLFVATVILLDDEEEESTYTNDTTTNEYTNTSNLDESKLRESYTQLNGDGSDITTIMLYLIGSDLESEDGCATTDLNEILSADLGSNINIVIQSSGTLVWNNKSLTNRVTQRSIVTNGNLKVVENLGYVSMVEPETVTDFITWTDANYSADRYFLIFWNHGGGTILGYGVDELYSDDMLELPEIGQALQDSGVKFDLVGFDACLMGTLETAFALEPYADYMIASEETEVGTGWYYTNWLNYLAKNPSADTVDIGKIIIDNYIEGPDSSFFDLNTLSIIDLKEIDNVYDKLCYYLDNASNLLNTNYNEISKARSNAKAFDDDDYEQIDMISYINELSNIDGANEIINAINSAVKYTNNSDYDVYGLAMYFPYDYPEYYNQTIQAIEALGYGGYRAFYDKFLNIPS